MGLSKSVQTRLFGTEKKSTIQMNDRLLVQNEKQFLKSLKGAFQQMLENMFQSNME